MDDDFAIPNKVICDFFGSDIMHSSTIQDAQGLCMSQTRQDNDTRDSNVPGIYSDGVTVSDNVDNHTDDVNISDQIYSAAGTSNCNPDSDVDQNQLGVFLNDSIETADGRIYYIPDVTDAEKPVIGTVFSSFEEARKMYEDYVEKAGFSIRLSTIKRKKDRQISHRYIVCNKNGKSKKKSLDSLEVGVEKIAKRSTSFKVTNCTACVRFKPIKGTSNFKLYEFLEAHNHELLVDENKDFCRSRRKLQFSEQQFIYRMSMSNVGPSISYRYRVLLSGGHRRARGTVTEYRNFRRDMNLFIGDRDAQMLVDKMAKRKLHAPNFSFDCKCIDNELVGLFWADEIAKLNYQSFGDVLAFDATYGTNRYRMSFVPFTAVDNHQRSVNVGGGLLKWENIDSFKWLLECFLKAHGTQPKLVLTDQDGAMKVAIEEIFSQSHHRLCMWHIMDKLSLKISSFLLANTDLRKRINKVVWNTYLLPSEFEQRWKDIIEEFDLNDNKWLHDMFVMRHRWIPAYFKHLPMCCLMKTTSRSESANASFKIYFNIENSLIQFMMSFETAMEAQRYETRKLDHHTKTTSPEFKTELPIERFAARVYCHEIFLKVQHEIHKGLYSCSTNRVDTDEGKHVRYVLDKDKISQAVSEFKVVFTLKDLKMECSCLCFERIGYVCRHIFYVMKDLGLDQLPSSYVLKRWSRDALPNDIFKISNLPQTIHEKTDEMFVEGVSIVESCLSRLRGDSDKMALFLDKLKKMKQDIFAELPEEPFVNSKEEIFKALLGVEIPEEVLIHAPKGIRNKGCGTSKRLKGPGEKVLEKMNKPLRLCRLCKQHVHHDSRNCRLNPKNKKKFEQLKKKMGSSKSKQAADS